MNNPDLFGGETTAPDKLKAQHKSGYMMWKQGAGYRKSDSKTRCCATCLHSRGYRASRTFYKCVKLGISHSTATDIRLRDVCNLWEKE